MSPVTAERSTPIRPIPREERTFRGLDLAILWGDLGIGVLVMVTGALLVPALGFLEAVAAIAVGSIFGVALLALGGVPGTQHGIPTMVLLRPVLGIRGSWLASGLNTLQLVGWTAVELWAMSYVADLVGRRVLGFSARPLWLVAAALICGGFAIWGPVGVTRVWMKRFAAWGIVAICLLLTALVVIEHPGALTTTGAGGWPTFGTAVDLVIAMPISWLPLVADYTRFARSGRAAFGGTFSGYLIANVWLYSLGVLLVSATGTTPSPAGMAAGILSLAGGSIAGILFLVGLLAGETDEAFADVYSARVSLQNIFPKAPGAFLVIAVVAVSALLAGWLTMERYESFLFLLGSAFVPLFGLLFADHFVNRRSDVVIDALHARRGPYWFRGGIRPAAVLAWLAGFVVFQWLAPAGPDWWTDLVISFLGATPLQTITWLPASLPAFAVAFAFGLALRSRPADIVDSPSVEAGEGS